VTVAGFDTFALIFSFWSSVAFLIGYTIISPWWRYVVGRALAALDACIMITLLPAALRDMLHFDTKADFFTWYGGFSLLLVGLTTLWRLWVVWSVQTSGTPRHVEVSADLSSSRSADERPGTVLEVPGVHLGEVEQL
jgi:hypothetical protein